MIAKVIYTNGEVRNEELSVSDAAVRLLTELDIKAIEFFEDALNELLA